MPLRGMRVAGAALVVALVACGGAGDAPPEPVAEEVAGECSDAFGAQVCTWARMNGDALVEVGATIPLASIENAPAEVEMMWPPPAVASVPFPQRAAAHGMRHMMMNWEPMGHPPVTFEVPHFDIHFYMIPPEERLTIDCTDLTKPSTLPAGYTLPVEVLPDEVAAMIGVKTLVGVCVPEMGMHSLVAAEMEATTAFSGTMVVGYYQGRPIFVEPMISKATLLERRSFDLAVPAVPGLEGRQPTVFRAEYDAGQDAYHFKFSGFAATN